MKKISDSELEQLEGGMTLACGLSIAGTFVSTALLVTAFAGIVTASGGIAAGGLLALGGNYASYVISGFALAISC